MPCSTAQSTSPRGFPGDGDVPSPGPSHGQTPERWIDLGPLRRDLFLAGFDFRGRLLRGLDDWQRRVIRYIESNMESNMVSNIDLDDAGPGPAASGSPAVPRAYSDLVFDPVLQSAEVERVGGRKRVPFAVRQTTEILVGSGSDDSVVRGRRLSCVPGHRQLARFVAAQRQTGDRALDLLCVGRLRYSHPW